MIVLEGQSIYDVTLQEFGTLKELYTLLEDNNLSATSKLVTGQELVINNTNVGDEDVKNFVTLRNITFNNNQGTGLPPIEAGDTNIDYGNDMG